MNNVDENSNIQSLLTNMKNNINSEIKEQGKTFKLNEKYYKELLNKLNSEKIKLNQDIDKNSQALAIDKKNFDLSEKKIIALKQKFDEKETLYKEFVSQRENESDNFNNKNNRLYDSVTALTEGRAIISRLKFKKPEEIKLQNNDDNNKISKEKNFLEVNNLAVFAEISNTLSKTRYKDGKFSGFVNAFANIFSTEIIANQNIVKNVFKMINFFNF